MYQILLVEDDRALALAVQKLLESYGSRVRCVEDFADVLGEFAACQPQLVLMDEPSAALDPKNRRNLINILRSLPCAQLIASHDLDFIYAA